MARMPISEGSDKPYSGDPEIDALTYRVKLAMQPSRSKASDTKRMPCNNVHQMRTVSYVEQLLLCGSTTELLPYRIVQRRIYLHL